MKTQTTERRRRNKPTSNIGEAGFFYTENGNLASSPIMGLSMFRNLEVRPTDRLKEPDYFDICPEFPVAEIGTNYIKLLPGYVYGKSEEEKQYNQSRKAEQKEIDEFLKKYRGESMPTDDKRKKNLTAGQHSNAVMSAPIRRKIKTIGSAWINSLIVAEQYIKYQKAKRVMPDYLRRGSEAVFITLTIPGKQRHTDNEIKSKALDRYLRALTWKQPDINYMWVAELQKRGAIHFHILTDRYINKNWSDTIWSKAMNAMGYNADKLTGNRCEKIKADEMPGYLAQYFTKVNFDELSQIHSMDCTFERKFTAMKHPSEEEKTIIIPHIEGRKYGINKRLLDMFKSKKLSAFRINLQEFHEFRRWLYQQMKTRGKSTIIYKGENCLMIRNSLKTLPIFVKNLFWLHFYDIWSHLNPNTQKNVSKFTFSRNETSHWRHWLASVRFNTIYTAPINIPNLTRTVLPVNEGIFNLFERPAGR
jgi:hypothetical protein